MKAEQVLVMSEDLLTAHLKQLRHFWETNHLQLQVDGRDAFAWWQTNLRHPQRVLILACLAPLAKMYLAFPASSADLERSFSSAGFILEGRERLQVRFLEEQVVIRDYLLMLRRKYPAKEDYLAQVASLLNSLSVPQAQAQ